MKHASGKKKPVVIIAPKVKKSQPKKSAKTVKSAVKKAAVFVVPVKPTKPGLTAVIVKSKSEKNQPKNVKNTVKAAAAKSTQKVSVRMMKRAAAKIPAVNKKAVPVKTQTISAARKTKAAAAKNTVSVEKKAKISQTVIPAKISKNAKIQTTLPPRKAKLKGAVSKAITGDRKPKTKPAKVETIALSGKIESAKSKPLKLKSIVSVKQIKSAKLPIVATTKKIKNPEPKILVEKKKTAKVTSSAAVKENKVEKRKIKPAVSVKAASVEVAKIKPDAIKRSDIQGQKIFAAIKIRRQKIDFSPKSLQTHANKAGSHGNGKASRNGARAEVETAENKIAAVEASAAQKPKKRKAKAIAAAVFRGKKARYDFQVFPLDSEFDAVTSGIYVISKRKTDRNKRAHHALVCIGQTDSVAGEIKRHAKKCIKKFQANVISILPEANEKKRLKIEEDLKSAHSTACGIL